MTRKRTTHKISSFEEGIVGIIGLCIVGVFVKYHNQLNRIGGALTLISITIIIFIIGMYIIWKYLNRESKKYHTGKYLMGLVNQNNLKDDLYKFIKRWGLESGVKQKSAWIPKNNSRYRFEPTRLVYLKNEFKKKGLDLTIEDLKTSIESAIDEIESKLTIDSIHAPIQNDLDRLTGSEFEHLLSRLIESDGYTVQRIGGSGDQGGDLIANKKDQRVLVQAKRYTGTVSNKAVQEAAAAKIHYDCNKAMVFSTGTFTSGAIALAKTNNIELIGRHELIQHLNTFLNESWS